MLASIPSPGSNGLEIGGLDFRAYGLLIAIGVVVAVWMAGKRLEERGHSADAATTIAMWAVPAGLVGARAYHVITDWRRFEGRWGEAFKIWEGGLGILGAIVAGAIVGLWVARREGIPVLTLLDVAAPAIALAQAIGRWGNWFNQELFGKPTDLPWGLEIDVENRPADHIGENTFHPTFLYESLWNLALVGLLLWVDRKRVLGPGRLFALYVAGYAVGRLWIESLRIDPASELGGVRVNIWVFAVVAIVALVVLARGRKAAADRDAPRPDETGDDEAHDEPVEQVSE